MEFFIWTNFIYFTFILSDFHTLPEAKYSFHLCLEATNVIYFTSLNFSVRKFRCLIRPSIDFDVRSAAHI